MRNTKFSGRKIESGIPGIPLGNPIADLVGSTRFRSLLGPSISGQRLGGGSIPLITHSRNATRSRLTRAVAGTGFARNVPRPQLLPGQLTAVVDGLSSKPPPPPPCVEFGRIAPFVALGFTA